MVDRVSVVLFVVLRELGLGARAGREIALTKPEDEAADFVGELGREEAEIADET